MDFSRVCEEAQPLAKALERTAQRIVFAESCTGGMVAAALASVPGISRWLCGSAVTYREATKQQWLAVDEQSLRQHTAVSEVVACEMAAGALEQTPEADLAVAVTGHLGPQAPEGFDGVVFVATARRHESPKARRMQLSSAGRGARQAEAAVAVLQRGCEALRSINGGQS